MNDKELLKELLDLITKHRHKFPAVLGQPGPDYKFNVKSYRPTMSFSQISGQPCDHYKISAQTLRDCGRDDLVPPRDGHTSSPVPMLSETPSGASLPARPMSRSSRRGQQWWPIMCPCGCRSCTLLTIRRGGVFNYRDRGSGQEETSR